MNQRPKEDAQSEQSQELAEQEGEEFWESQKNIEKSI